MSKKGLVSGVIGLIIKSGVDEDADFVINMDVAMNWRRLRVVSASRKEEEERSWILILFDFI